MDRFSKVRKPKSTMLCQGFNLPDRSAAIHLQAQTRRRAPTCLKGRWPSTSTSIWGDVELRNLTLKPEALQDLDLPCTVKAGLLGRLTLKVPDRLLVLSALHQSFSCSSPQDLARFVQQNSAKRSLTFDIWVWHFQDVINIVYAAFKPCTHTSVGSQPTRRSPYSLQVPWARLGQEPVVAEFDRLYILAEPHQEDAGTKGKICVALPEAQAEEERHVTLEVVQMESGASMSEKKGCVLVTGPRSKTASCADTKEGGTT
eukprot:scaffold179638_cov19-Tisochrysis_lutea.AAC.1